MRSRILKIRKLRELRKPKPASVKVKRATSVGVSPEELVFGVELD